MIYAISLNRNNSSVYPCSHTGSLQLVIARRYFMTYLCIFKPFTASSDLPTRFSRKAAFLISLFLVLYFCLVSVVLTYGAALFGTFVRAKEF